MNRHEFLFIGSEFIVGVVFMKNGTAMAQAPHVTLRDRERNTFYVADFVVADGINYFVKFTSDVTEAIQPAALDLEIYADSSKEVMLRYWPKFTTAVKVSASPEQTQEPENA